MKKMYITPHVETMVIKVKHSLMAGSITEVEGTAGVRLAGPNDDVPTEAGAKGGVFGFLDDEYE